MTFQTALDNLCARYEKYGYTRGELSKLLQGGIIKQVFRGKRTRVFKPYREVLEGAGGSRRKPRRLL